MSKQDDVWTIFGDRCGETIAAEIRPDPLGLTGKMKVAALEDVLVQKLLALGEQQPDYLSVLELARSLREQVNWDEVRERMRDSPFANAYFTLLGDLEIVSA